MFSSGANYGKLKTNLRLCINRLKLLEKKKTEMALKSRKEIADYIAMGKVERAKIRVEHIVREDYLVEALELMEMFCDLLLARFGLIQQMKTLDDGLAEAISSIIWVTPRLQADVQELKIVSDQLTAKYGKPYAMACRENGVGTVSEKLMHKLSVQAPPKLTVEKYMIEIAKYYNVEYEPDSQVLSQDETYAADALIDLAPAPPLPEKNDLGAPGSGPLPPQMPPGGAGGAVGGSSAPPPQEPYVPFNYPMSNPGAASVPPYGYAGAGVGPTGGAGAMSYQPQNGPAFNIPPEEKKGALNYDDTPPPAYAYFPPDVNDTTKASASASGPAGQPGGTNIPRTPSVEDNTAKGEPGSNHLDLPDLPDLPVVPSDSPARGNSPDDDDDDEKKEGNNDEEIDFDDLTKRFEALKRKK